MSLLLTGLAWHMTQVSTSARVRNRFHFRTSVIESTIRQRLSSYDDLLRGLAGLFDANGEVTRGHWERYLRSVRPDQSTPGLQAVGFIARIAAAERPRLERQEQADGLPFRVWPEGDRAEFHTIVYVHPFDRTNASVLGFDMWTEAVGREALVRARDEGVASLSRHVRLLQDDPGAPARPGFILFMPVYRSGIPTSTVAERRLALRGFIYGAFRVKDVMASTFDGLDWNVDFEIYDSEQASEDGLLYRSASSHRLLDEMTRPQSVAQRMAIDVGGRRWLMLAMPSADFLTPAERQQYWLIAGGGLAINLLFAFGFWASGSVRKRAVVMAEAMSNAMRVNDAQTQLTIDSITDHAIFRLDVDRQVASWNAGAERMLGYTEAEALARPASRFWVGQEGNPYIDETASAERQTREGWHTRKDGHRFWGATAVAPLQHGGGLSGYVVILRDDTSRRRAMEALAETSAALEQRTVELGRFNRLASGRELRMIELKRLVNERSVQLGMSPPFDLSFAADFTDVPRPRELS